MHENVNNASIKNNGLVKQDIAHQSMFDLMGLSPSKHSDAFRPTITMLMAFENDTISMQEFLRFEKHNVACFESLIDFQKWWSSNDFEIIIIEIDSINDPRLIWLQNNSEIKNKGVIVISQKQDVLTRIISLKSGADYFLNKPILHDEILININNLIRRIGKAKTFKWRLQLSEWLLISPNGNKIKLTHSEKTVLERLAQKPGNVVVKDDIALALGSSPNVYDFRRLEIIIRRLRNKVFKHTGIKLPLDTAHRKGYSFTADIQVWEYN